MILSYCDLLQVRDRGVLTGAAPDAVKAASIDVRLGRRALLEQRDPAWKDDEIGLVQVSEPADLAFADVDLSETYFLQPGEFILVHLEESLDLPNNLSAEFRLRSSAGRMGLVHGVAVLAESGYRGQLTLELKNATQHHLIGLTAGDRIGKLVFLEHKPVPFGRGYEGKFNNAVGVAGASNEER